MRRDEEVEDNGSLITAREHSLRKTAAGRYKYPFKAMLINDYFRVFSAGESVLVRSALQSFYSRTPTRRFSVRQRDDGEWVCRRVA